MKPRQNSTTNSEDFMDGAQGRTQNVGWQRSALPKARPTRIREKAPFAGPTSSKIPGDALRVEP